MTDPSIQLDKELEMILTRLDSRTFSSRIINPDDIRMDIKILINRFRTDDDKERLYITKAVNLEHSSALLGYAYYMAECAIREKSQNDIEDGLAAIILEGFRSDYRESLRRLCLLFNSASLLGLDMSIIYNNVENLADKDVSRFLNDYRLKGEKQINKMGFQSYIGPEGFSYTNSF